jgi:hypothetical protein
LDKIAEHSTPLYSKSEHSPTPFHPFLLLLIFWGAFIRGFLTLGRTRTRSCGFESKSFSRLCSSESRFHESHLAKRIGFQEFTPEVSPRPTHGSPASPFGLGVCKYCLELRCFPCLTFLPILLQSTVATEAFSTWLLC